MNPVFANEEFLEYARAVTTSERNIDMITINDKMVFIKLINEPGHFMSAQLHCKWANYFNATGLDINVTNANNVVVSEKVCNEIKEEFDPSDHITIN